MIKSDKFYKSFDSGFQSKGFPEGVKRLKGKVSKYNLETPHGNLIFWFQVNQKASALPTTPGEFWPDIFASDDLKRDDLDNGNVSWYQYTTDAETEHMQSIQKNVYEKFILLSYENEPLRLMRDANSQTMKQIIEQKFKPNFPHAALYYLDEQDAYEWGILFSKQIHEWDERFSAQPETLNSFMWRVHWSKQ